MRPSDLYVLNATCTFDLIMVGIAETGTIRLV
ncbi:hypothetical protein NIES3585_09150 [Nodularia sp. NIES-3585]|nr:hypothetical protein NIES3585_09150 [Nodularia sp. NIES-3585]